MVRGKVSVIHRNGVQQQRGDYDIRVIMECRPTPVLMLLCFFFFFGGGEREKEVEERDVGSWTFRESESRLEREEYMLFFLHTLATIVGLGIKVWENLWS